MMSYDITQFISQSAVVSDVSAAVHSQDELMTKSRVGKPFLYKLAHLLLPVSIVLLSRVGGGEQGCVKKFDKLHPHE